MEFPEDLGLSQVVEELEAILELTRVVGAEAAGLVATASVVLEQGEAALEVPELEVSALEQVN